MLKLEDIKKNAAIAGIDPGQIVRVVTTEPVGSDALTVYYKTADGNLRERMLFRADEIKLALAEAGRPWAFDAPGEAFKLVAEAYRINLAHLFDPMAIVLVDGDIADEPHYIRRPFMQEPDWAVSSVNLDLTELLKRAVAAGDIL